MTRLAVALLTLLGLGCTKVARETLDYGPEVSKAEINRALAEATGGISADRVRAGQSVAYLTTRRIGESDSETTLGAATMSAVVDPTADGQLKLLIDTTARDASGALKTTRGERPLSIHLAAKVAASETVDPAPTPAPAPRVSYFRLRTGRESLAAPAALRARENCGGLPRCELAVRYVLFEVVATPADGPPQRVSVTLGFSDQSPYLPYGEGFDRFNGALVVDCRTSSVTLDDRRIPIHECRKLVDFQF